MHAAPRPAGGASPASAAAGTSVQSDEVLEARLLAALNILRARAGMRPLRHSTGLAAAAEHHSRAMARNGFFSHTSADGSPFASRVERFYRRSNWRLYVIGENILYQRLAKSPMQLLQMWLASPSHRRNVYGRWREVGFGAVRATGAPGVYGGASVTIVTADFGIRE